jgi:hypothetical protein
LRILGIGGIDEKDFQILHITNAVGRQRVFAHHAGLAADVYF